MAGKIRKIGSRIKKAAKKVSSTTKKGVRKYHEARTKHELRTVARNKQKAMVSRSKAELEEEKARIREAKKRGRGRSTDRRKKRAGKHGWY